MNRPLIELDSFHHVYNRGVDKRIVFTEDMDYKQFVSYLHKLNEIIIESQSNVLDLPFTPPLAGEILKPDLSHPVARETKQKRKEKLTDVVAFCLMPNHFHLLLHERREGGISKFMQRLCTAYAMYFNEKEERSGALFQGKFKSKLIDDDKYLIKIVDYIHLNPKDLFKSRGEITSLLADFVSEYPWSSCRFYLDNKTYGNILNKNILNNYTGLPEDYKEWIKERATELDFEDISELQIDDQ